MCLRIGLFGNWAAFVTLVLRTFRGCSFVVKFQISPKYLYVPLLWMVTLTSLRMMSNFFFHQVERKRPSSRSSRTRTRTTKKRTRKPRQKLSFFLSVFILCSGVTTHLTFQNVLVNNSFCSFLCKFSLVAPVLSNVNLVCCVVCVFFTFIHFPAPGQNSLAHD